MPFTSAHDRYVPKHRQPPSHRAPRAALRTMVVLSSAAVLGTGAAVAGGSLGAQGLVSGLTTSSSDVDATASHTGSHAAAVAATGAARAAVGAAAADPAPAVEPDAATTAKAAAQADAQADADAEAARRTVPVSRSDRRGVADPRKQAALAVGGGRHAMTRSEDASDEDPRTIAAALVGDSGQFSCLDSLWTKESGWRIDADNPSSSAYGIPQALPGSKMSSFGADWATNPVTQIRWGLDYIEDRYGSPCGAWSHSQSNGWY